MFGFFPVFFSSASSFFFASAAWSSCGITGSMFSAITFVSGGQRVGGIRGLQAL